MNPSANLPLPSTGRGIEGEGWSVSRRSSRRERWAASPLTPALSPLRGEGEACGRVLTVCILLAIIVVAVGCATRLEPNPLQGWKHLGTAFEIERSFDRAITKDYRDYIATLPIGEKRYVLDYNISFFEDGTGRHAVEIAIPVDGIWWKHVLVYGADGNRVSVKRYSAGRYRA